MALADGVIKGYKSVTDLMSARIPPALLQWELQYEEGAGQTPVFCAMPKNGSPFRDPLSYRSMHAFLNTLLTRVGYMKPIGSHVLRRSVARKAYG